jgi:hypothetical protein
MKIVKNIYVLIFPICMYTNCQKAYKTTDASAISDAQKRLEDIRQKYHLKSTKVTLNYAGIEEKVRSGDTATMYAEFERFLQVSQKEEAASAERDRFYNEVVKPAVEKAQTKEEYIELAKKYPNYVLMPD